MSNKNYLKETFDCESKHEAFYTGGGILWSKDGTQLFCQNSGHISIVSVETGLVEKTISKAKENEEEDMVNSFAVSNDGSFIVSHHRSSLFKKWNLSDGKLMKVWKSIHNGPVAKISLGGKDSIMASGGIDNSVRLWNMTNYACMQNFKSVQGVVSALCFQPEGRTNLLFASADDHIIHAWDIKSGQEVITLKGHFNKVTSLSFHEDGIHLLSSGRDQVLILWDLEKKVSLKTLPIFECIEGAFFLPEITKIPVSKTSESIYAACAGEKGHVKIWDMSSSCLVYEQKNSIIPAAKEEGGLAITHVLFNSDINNVALVSANHNIFLHNLEDFACTKQLVGYIGEIYDIIYIGKDNSFLAVAANSPDIKLFELATMKCQILSGHKNSVLSLASSPANRYLMLSSDKDYNVRLWLMDETSKIMSCIREATKHTSEVGSVALSQTSITFFASGDKTACLKLWELPNDLKSTGESKTLQCVNTVVAHEKEINYVTVSPNDKLIATASADKTTKLWSADKLQLMGVFRGHRKGVWCAKFSKVDQVVATSSADNTIKLWSLSELNCLMTFEGHECSVMRIEFISKSTQLLSAGGDGLIKLWNVKTGECVTTLDEHDDRIWSFVVNKSGNRFVSSDASSLLVTWRDTTQERKDKAIAEKAELVQNEQKLENYVKLKKLTKALKLALKLNKPFKAFNIVEVLINKGDDELKSTIFELKPQQQEELLDFVVKWNANARLSQVAQEVLYVFLSEIGLENVQTSDLKEKLEALIPYTERHFKRVTELYKDLHLLSYTISCMKVHSSVMDDHEI